MSPAELTAIAEPSEEDLFTLAVARAHADNSKAPAWQERRRHYSPASQLAISGGTDGALAPVPVTTSQAIQLAGEAREMEP
ncbi:hypothetical protein EYF80_016899 [Liparis tanakae]|uniref:Uncharacterized protein n=1 Tax=Liparis tanakae TaxID=230148 RepID=A0A4Z2I4A1_9TELE|nr:hypothetical protein EYF80_016899 [Liparis tanakae]